MTRSLSKQEAQAMARYLQKHHRKEALIKALVEVGDFLLGQFPPKERTIKQALYQLGLLLPTQPRRTV